MKIRCKYVDAHSVIWLRNPLREGNVVYSNPSDELLLSLGYLPLEDSPRREALAGYVQVASYRVEEGRIIRTWNYEKEEE